jgi:hypothetical protein
MKSLNNKPVVKDQVTIITCNNCGSKRSIVRQIPSTIGTGDKKDLLHAYSTNCLKCMNLTTGRTL